MSTPHPPQPEHSAGYDMARRALEQARAQAAASGRFTGQGRNKPVPVGGRRRRKHAWTKPGRDYWDPHALGELIADVARRNGWAEHIIFGRIQARWSHIVGADIAAHVQPERLDGGVLYCQATSTAWATQMRLYQRPTLQAIAEACGPDFVTRLRIAGPAAPSWKKGPLHVSGRGPRDTYG